MDVNEENCIYLVDKAKDAGAELFVIDDGWFPDRCGDQNVSAYSKDSVTGSVININFLNGSGSRCGRRAQSRTFVRALDRTGNGMRKNRTF